MCGIAGYYALLGDPDCWAADLPAATDALAARGPDDRGLWFGEHGRVGLGHRRLAIQDLSAAGHQPMQSRCGRWSMVFNGEVYNFLALRRELEALGHAFLGSGDSEVILAAFAQWGAEAVERFVGMFAIVLYHHPTRQLHLLRDRLGVKPLHYRWDGRVLAFASELKALRAFGAWSASIDRAAMGDFLVYGYIADPATIYAGVHKLPPAHRMVVHPDGRIEQQRYWSPSDHLGRRAGAREDDLVDELEALLVDAFEMRMIADVPVGVFLSGGVDSSLVASLLHGRGGRALKTFTIGFDQPEYDESGAAAAVARHLGTEHHVETARVEDAKAILPQWGALFDEPFGDESGVPTLMVSRMAARHVKVVLSADGGDEMFSGYNAYATALDQWDRLKGHPQGLRDGVQFALGAARVGALDAFLAGRGGAAAGALRGAFASRLARVQSRIGARHPGDLMDQMVAHFSRHEVASLTGTAPASRAGAAAYPGSAIDQLSLWDVHHYLPGDVLTKVDRASMSVSIEGREPLLDHRIAEFAFSLPVSMRRGDLGPKHLLRKVLYRHVPRELVDRPKRGFGIPVKQWLAGDLFPMTRELLDDTALRHQGLFDPALVQSLLRRQRLGDASVRRRVWLLVAFQLWHRRWMNTA